MSIRIIVRECDEGAACNVGGPVHESYRTFDVELPEVEAFLCGQSKYISRDVIGVELLVTTDIGSSHER